MTCWQNRIRPARENKAATPISTATYTKVPGLPELEGAGAQEVPGGVGELIRER